MDLSKKQKSYQILTLVVIWHYQYFLKILPINIIKYTVKNLRNILFIILYRNIALLKKLTAEGWIEIENVDWNRKCRFKLNVNIYRFEILD